MILRTLLALLISASLLSVQGDSAEIDDALTAAKKEYEESLSNARKDLISQLTRRIEAAEKSKKTDSARNYEQKCRLWKKIAPCRR